MPPKAAVKIPGKEKLKFTEGRCQVCIGGKSFPFYRANDIFQGKYTSSARGIKANSSLGKIFRICTKFFPGNIPTIEGRCQSFYSRKSKLTPSDDGKTNVQGIVSNCLSRVYE